jgi:antitoxin component of MazEF toxin-antitoxin module
MRVFRHGDALAIVFPQSIVSSSGLKENEELDFVEAEKGVFVLLRKEKMAELARQKLEKLDSSFSKPFASPSASSEKSFFKRELEMNGFVVVFAEKGAQEESREMEQEIKSGSVVGTRGFDKKFYVATREFLESQSPKILKVLKDGALSTIGIAEKTKIPEDGVKAALCILMDEGEVIEKKKGFFAVA